MHNASQGQTNPATPNRSSLTIAQKVAAAGVQVSDDAMINFGSMARQTVDPIQSPIGVAKSYWFKYGDIKNLTLIQVQAAAIGPMAMASRPGGADYMRVTGLPSTQFNRVSGNNFAGIDEYDIGTPVPVRQSVYVGD